MQKRSTLVVLAALLLIFGYYTWEHYSEKKYESKEREYDEREGENEEDEKEMEEMERKLERQDGIDKAMAYEFELTKDPVLNTVPRERLLAADNYRKQKLAALSSSRTTTAVSGINWSERGPNNVGGRTRAIIYDLNDAGNGYKKVFAGSVGGGLWATNDISAGTPTWTRLDDFMGNLAVSTLAQDPSNTQNIYAGTGEGWFNSDAIRGLGIWKSSDGGTSWAQLSSTNNSTFYYTQKIVVTSAGVILAATRNGGIQRSTDGGSSWTKVLGAGTGGGSDNSAADIEIGANGNIYASIGIFTTDGIYRSTDGGVNWTKIYTSASDEMRVELACAPSNQNVIYALLHDNDNDGIKKVMSTTDATVATPTWNTLTTPNWCDQGSASTDFTRGQAWYDLIAAVDPSNANNVFIGGVDILKTTDGGTTWSQVSRWAGACTGAQIHADNHMIVFKPGSSTELLIGNDGGIYRTTDGGTTITSRVSSYNVTQYYACAIHPTLSNYFLAGAQDNGSQKFSTAGINTTSTASGGDGAFCHIDQTDGNIQITSYVFNNYYVSVTGGTTFIQRFFSPSGTNGEFINPTDYDNNTDILYGAYGAGSFFRWNDAGAAGSNTDNVTVTNFSGAKVRHVAVSPLTSNRVYFGLNNGSVVKVDNANTGTALTGTVIKTGTGSVSCIAIDPANEDHMLVTYSNFGVTSIYESLNATQASPTWTAVEGNLPDMPVRWAMFDPRNSDWALIATDIGVWSTDNLNGASTDWDPTNSGLANVRVDMLQYRASDRTIAAATHGRGLFTAVVPLTTTPDISFASSTAATTELTTSTSGCRSYTDYSVNMLIANAPTGDANVAVNIGGGAATQGVDYDFTTNGNFASPSTAIVFTNGSTASKTISIRIYDDAEVEGAQTFILTYSISGTTNAQAGSFNQTYTFTINDNDSAPTGASSANYTVATFDVNSSMTSPFQSANKRARSQFLITASELSAAGLVGGRQITALAWYTITKATTNPFNGFTISMGHTTATDLNTGYITPTFTQVFSGNHTTATGWQTITFSTPFTWDGTSNLLVQTCFDNGGSGATPGIDVVQGTLAPLGSSIAATAFEATNAGGTAGCSLSATTVSASRPQFIFTQAVPQTPIESALNATRSFYLGPNADVYLYSAADGELIARIQNQSSHDYGCTSIQIVRAGTGISQFWNSNIPNYLMNKAFRIIPTNNNPSGQYTITLYLSSAEVTGWQTATGQSWANIQLIKIPSQINNVTPLTPEPDGPGTVQVVTPTLGTLGTHYSLSYPFNNGFSGFGAGIPGALGLLPVELLSFTGKLQNENVKLNWSASFEQNSKGFEIEKSLDGINFRKIGFVAGAGNSNSTRNYSFTDPQLAVEFNYYRLKLVDIDNKFSYSDVVLVKNAFGKQDVYLAGNPITNSINIQFAKTPNSKVAVSIYDMRGSKVYEATYNNYTQTSLQINTANKLLAHGVYSVKVETGGNIYNLKAIK